MSIDHNSDRLVEHSLKRPDGALLDLFYAPVGSTPGWSPEWFPVIGPVEHWCNGSLVKVYEEGFPPELVSDA